MTTCWAWLWSSSRSSRRTVRSGRLSTSLYTVLTVRSSSPSTAMTTSRSRATSSRSQQKRKLVSRGVGLCARRALHSRQFAIYPRGHTIARRHINSFRVSDSANQCYSQNFFNFNSLGKALCTISAVSCAGTRWQHLNTTTSLIMCQLSTTWSNVQGEGSRYRSQVSLDSVITLIHTSQSQPDKTYLLLIQTTVLVALASYCYKSWIVWFAVPVAM